MAKEIAPRINVDPEVLGGKPVIAGTRVPVELVLEFLSNEWDPEAILREYPSLKKEDIQAVISYAAYRVKQEEYHFVPSQIPQNFEGPAIAA